MPAIYSMITLLHIDRPFWNRPPGFRAQNASYALNCAQSTLKLLWLPRPMRMWGKRVHSSLNCLNRRKIFQHVMSMHFLKSFLQHGVQRKPVCVLCQYKNAVGFNNERHRGQLKKGTQVLRRYFYPGTPNGKGKHIIWICCIFSTMWSNYLLEFPS